jgi:leucyl-tRNA synthetase
MDEVNFSQIEKKMAEKMGDEKVFEVSEDSKKPKYYVLEMFPYPSGSVSYWDTHGIILFGDILSRFKIMNGFNVLHPMGYDALGLPAENAAIKEGVHPKIYNASIKNYIKQTEKLGLTYDWSRMVNTASSEYYKGTSGFF